MTGQVIDDLVGSQGVAGQDDVPVAFRFGKVQIGLDIFVGVSEAFVP